MDKGGHGLSLALKDIQETEHYWSSSISYFQSRLSLIINH